MATGVTAKTVAEPGTTVAGVRFLVVAAWQARMVRGGGVWLLARRGADGGRELLCAGWAEHSAGADAERSTEWRAARRAGGDEFLFTTGLRDRETLERLFDRVRAHVEPADRDLRRAA